MTGKTLLKLGESARFILSDRCNGDPRPACNDIGYVLGAYGIVFVICAFPERLFTKEAQPVLLVSESCGAFEVLIADRLLLFAHHIAKLSFVASERARAIRKFYPLACRRLIDKVDRFVGEKSAVYIACRKPYSRFYCLVGDPESMVLLITAAQTAENTYGIFFGRLSDIHRLKAALECRIFFDVHAVFAYRCCTDDLKLSACQSRFQYICRIDRALGSSRADHGVYLVNEQYYGIGFCDLLHDTFHPVLKLAAVFCPGDH